MAGLVLGLILMAPTGLILFVDVLVPDAWFELSYLFVAAALFGLYWAVGSSLTKKYEAAVHSVAARATGQLVLPASVNRTYGLMLISLLPYLLYLFAFALYCVEFVVVWGIIGISEGGRIPLFLPIGLFLMAAGSLWGVGVGLWRLAMPPASNPLGVSLSRQDCPRLWALSDKVAQDAGTKPADTIILTPDAGIAVWEKGVLPAVLAGSGTRHLQIGLSGIHDMTVCELMSVLRHEYAHFAHSDTRWGSFTYAMGQSLVSAFAATPGLSALANGFSWVRLVLAINPAWFVYALFVPLYFRSTGGFSRLGEVLADRDAILYAGGGTFARALSKVVVNGWAHSEWFAAEGLTALRNTATPIPRVAAAVGSVARALSAEETLRVRDAAASSDWEERSPYDSHPTLQSRLALAGAIGSSAMEDACEAAWSLIDDWNGRDRQVSDVWFGTVRGRLAST